MFIGQLLDYTRSYNAFGRFLFTGFALAPLISVKCLGSSFFCRPL
jgi:hypothetical protein